MECLHYIISPLPAEVLITGAIRVGFVCVACNEIALRRVNGTRGKSERPVTRSTSLEPPVKLIWHKFIRLEQMCVKKCMRLIFSYYKCWSQIHLWHREGKINIFRFCPVVMNPEWILTSTLEDKDNSLCLNWGKNTYLLTCVGLYF